MPGNDVNRITLNIQQKLEKRVLDIQKRVAKDTLRKLVERTPVDTGCARGNWTVSVGEPSDAYDKTATSETRSAETVIAEGEAVIEQATFGTPIHIQNNAPYILALEYGWSDQAPTGFIRLTQAEIQASLDSGTYKGE